MESVQEREARIERLAEARGRRGVEDRSMTRATVPPIFFPEAESGAVVSPRNAMGISTAFAAIRALADAAASLPLHVYRRGAAGRERVDDHPTARSLRRPAPGVPTGLLVWQMVATLNLHGEAFLGLYGGETGAVEQLALIAPDRVEVTVRGGVPLYTVTGEDGRRGTYTADDVVHVRGMTLDGVRGVSPVRVAREALGYAQTLAEHGSRSMRNGARPTGVLTVAAGPGAEELAAKLRDDFKAATGGERTGSVAVLTGEAKFEAVSMTLQDAQYLEQRDLSDAEVARIFRVPPWMLGIKSGDSLTYSTVAEQARAFVTFALRPWLVAIEQALGSCDRLFPDGSGLYPLFELDGLLRGDAKARADVYTAALNPQTGWMQRGEVRALEDLPAERTAEEAPHA